MGKDQSVRQKYLGEKGLTAFIAFLSAFVPLSMDFYLPALPGMADYFHTSTNLINLTLSLFFIFFSSGVLFWGPLSDKYGRKPVLTGGMLVYITAGILCASAHDVYQLIVFRILQALGSGSAVAISTAMIKDVWSGPKLDAVMSVTQTLYFLAPAIAPVLGALVLKYTTWKGVFWVLAAIGLAGLAGSLALEETLQKPSALSLPQTLGRLGTVMKNRGFLFLLVLFSAVMIPHGAYIAASSFIYVNRFAVSEQAYGCYFALNALFLMTGPMVYLRLSRRFARQSIITACLMVVAASGLLIMMLGGFGPWMLVLTLMPGTIANSCIRPPSAVLMLEQQQEDIGSASSLMNCFRLLLGSGGMLLVSFQWQDIIFILGGMNLITGLVCGVIWLFASRRSFIKQGMDIRGVKAQPTYNK